MTPSFVRSFIVRFCLPWQPLWKSPGGW